MNLKRARPARAWLAIPAMSIFFAFAMLMASFAAEKVPVEAKVAGDLKQARFVAFLSKKVDYRIFAITDPYRIIVDLEEAEVQVPSSKSRGLVLSSRAGLLAPGRSRIVIDLAEPALVEKAELLAPGNGLPARLVIDLTRSTHRAFLNAAKAPPPLPQQSKASQQASLNTSPTDKRPLIVIDPGHGGVDAGAHGRVTNTAEKDVTFDFATILKEKLEATGRYRLLMTRTQDIFIPLDERADMAVNNRADLLISIHADALDPKRLGVRGLQEVRGGTIYTLSDEASDEQSKAIAQNENKADQQAGVGAAPEAAMTPEIASILSDLESRNKKNLSLAFANHLIEQLKGSMKFNLRPHRSANFRVLRAAGVPAVLIELGYLSNDEDEKLLTSPEWRAATASKIADAVAKFMAEHQARIPL